MNCADRAVLSMARPAADIDVLDNCEAALSDIKERAIKMRLFMLIYGRLAASSSISDRSRLFQQAYNDQYLHLAARTMRMASAEDEAVARLGIAGIEAIVIKGNALARDIYGDPNCRMSADVDMLVRNSDVTAAVAVLEGMGYVAESRLPIGFLTRRLHHILLQHQTSGINLELHWNFGIPGFFSLGSEEIWHEVLRNEAGHSGLSLPMTVIMLIIHHHMHFYKDIWVLTDLFHAVAKLGPEADFDALAQRLRRYGLLKSALISVHQIRLVWPEAGIDIECTELFGHALERAGALVSERLLNYFSARLFGPGAESFMDRCLTRLTLDRPSVVLWSFIKSILPQPSAVMELYADHRVIMLPWYYSRFILWRLGMRKAL